MAGIFLKKSFLEFLYGLNLCGFYWHPELGTVIKMRCNEGLEESLHYVLRSAVKGPQHPSCFLPYFFNHMLYMFIKSSII